MYKLVLTEEGRVLTENVFCNGAMPDFENERFSHMVEIITIPYFKTHLNLYHCKHFTWKKQ